MRKITWETKQGKIMESFPERGEHEKSEKEVWIEAAIDQQVQKS
ncbi:hypothetical protein [Acididesulfobacillus acetoxydans]|nr:hypothetical protein [Acididesulfobacillus acetoxydans]